jgi:hypothetical protein
MPWRQARPNRRTQTSRGAFMTTDLKYLVFMAILTASFWIPYVVAQVRTDERSSCSGKLRRSRAPDWCRCGDNVRTRLSQRTGGFCTVCSAGDYRPHHQQGECDDSVLGGVILLAAVGPCRGLSGCYPIPQNGDFHLGLCRIGWNGLGSDQVGANIRVNPGRSRRSPNGGGLCRGGFCRSERGLHHPDLLVVPRAQRAARSRRSGYQAMDLQRMRSDPWSRPQRRHQHRPSRKRDARSSLIGKSLPSRRGGFTLPAPARERWSISPSS